MSDNNDNNNSDRISKKRKEEELNNDETTPKKQKIDSDGSTSTTTSTLPTSATSPASKTSSTSSKIISIDDISTLGMGTLHKIASSLQLSVRPSIKKDELINRIKWALTRRENTEKQKTIRDNLDSFSIGYANLTIKEGLGPCEITFWKVFKNKVLFKNIMSNMNKRFTVDYNSINSVTKMVKYNQLSILRDKVIRNQYLVFHHLGKRQFNYGSHDNGKLQNNEIFKIFKLIQENSPQDYLFYKCFFYYYKPFIFNFIHIKDNNDQIVKDIEKGREYLVNQIIEAKCLISFNVLVNEYNYKPTEPNFIHAVNMGSTKFLNPIISLINKKVTTTTTTITAETSQIIVSTASQSIGSKSYGSQSSGLQSTAQPKPAKPFEFNEEIIEMLLKNKSDCSLASFESLSYLIEIKSIDLEKNAINGNDDNNVVLQYARNIIDQVNENINIKTLVQISKVISITNG